MVKHLQIDRKSSQSQRIMEKELNLNHERDHTVFEIRQSLSPFLLTKTAMVAPYRSCVLSASLEQRPDAEVEQANSSSKQQLTAIDESILEDFY